MSGDAAIEIDALERGSGVTSIAGSLHDLTFPQLADRISEYGIRPVHAKAVWRAMYRELAESFSENDRIQAPVQRWLQGNPPSLDWLKLVTETASSDGLTRKCLLELGDRQQIESVVMGYEKRLTACISTQVGCAMGCVFCATGQMGFGRHLRPGEIVGQVLFLQRALRNSGNPGLRNLVLMGMGEPLHNYDAVMTALEIISDTRGFNIGPSRITISTVGVVPGIVKLAEENRPYGLAVSLHASNQEERAKLIPSAQRWGLDELMDACRFYTGKLQKRIFFEWTLISGANDSPETARELVALIQNIPAHVNLIPLNPTDKYSGDESSKDRVFAFQQIIKDAGIPCTVRQRRGIDVAAGCGMLKSEKVKR